MTGVRPTLEVVAEALRAAGPTLDPAEQRLALELYRLLLHGKPVTPGGLASSAGVDIATVEAALDRWPGVFRDRKRRIVGFWGVAIRGMPHRMVTRSGDITTWCALDPLLIAPLITDEARVESTDPISGAPIRLTVTPGGPRAVRPPEARVSMVVPDGPFGHDVVEEFCHQVHFFASPATADRWVTEHPGTFHSSVAEAYTVASRSWPALFGDAVTASDARSGRSSGSAERIGESEGPSE